MKDKSYGFQHNVVSFQHKIAREEGWQGMTVQLASQLEVVAQQEMTVQTVFVSERVSRHLFNKAFFL